MSENYTAIRSSRNSMLHWSFPKRHPLSASTKHYPISLSRLAKWIDNTFIKCQWIPTAVLLYAISNIQCTYAQSGATTTTAASPGPLPANVPWDDNEQTGLMPKVVTIVIIAGGAILIGMLVGKLVEYCHERNSINDNASDMSDYTRQLLKAQLMLAFSKGKKKNKGKPEDFAKKYGKIWQGKVMRNKARKLKAEKEKVGFSNDKATDEKKPTGRQERTGAQKNNSIKTAPNNIKANTNTKNVPKSWTNGTSVTPIGPKVTLTVVDETKNTPSAKQASITPAVTASNDTATTMTHSHGSPTRIAPSPSKVASPKATVKKTNVGSRPVSAGLKKAGVARPTTAKSRPGTAKGRNGKE